MLEIITIPELGITFLNLTNQDYIHWMTEDFEHCSIDSNSIQQPQHLCAGLGFLQPAFCRPVLSSPQWRSSVGHWWGPDLSRLVVKIRTSNSNSYKVKPRYPSHNLQRFLVAGLIGSDTSCGDLKETVKAQFVVYYCLSLDTPLWLWKLTPEWLEAARPDGESPNATAAHASQPQTPTDT